MFFNHTRERNNDWCSLLALIVNTIWTFFCICDISSSQHVVSKPFFPQGCFEKVQMWFDDNKHIFGTVGMCILIMQVGVPKVTNSYYCCTLWSIGRTRKEKQSAWIFCSAWIFSFLKIPVSPPHPSEIWLWESDWQDAK